MALQKSHAYNFQKEKQHIENHYAEIRGIQEPEAMTGVKALSECCSEHN